MTDYFSDLVMRGQTGTADPAAAGLPVDTPWGEPGGMKLLRFLRSQGSQFGVFGPPPANFYPRPPPPPPIPGPEDMPQYAPPAPAPEPQFRSGDPGGTRRTFALLADPQPTLPFGPDGPDLNELTQNPKYAWLRDSLMQGAASAPPAAAQTAAAPPPAAPQAQPLGANIERHAARLDADPRFGNAQAPSVKPGFYDNLLRFGLAAMAAGGKPGATTLGALGEAGTSTFDANAKAKQSDIENAFAGRKLDIKGQELISRAYERLDKLKADSINMQLSFEQRAEAARNYRELQLYIAVMQNQSRQDALGEAGRANTIREQDLQGQAADRAARTAETAQRDAAQHYNTRREGMEKRTPLGVLSEEQETQLIAETATGFPNSNYARVWEQRKQGYLDTVRRGLAANPNDPAMRKKAIDKLRSLGINPREL